MTAQSKMEQSQSAPKRTPAWSQLKPTAKLRLTLVPLFPCQFIQRVARFSAMVAILVIHLLKESMMEIHLSAPKSSAKIMASHFVWHITIGTSASNGLMAATLARFLIQKSRPGIVQDGIAQNLQILSDRIHTVEFQEKAEPSTKIFLTLGTEAFILEFRSVWVFWWVPIFWNETKNWF